MYVTARVRRYKRTFIFHNKKSIKKGLKLKNHEKGRLMLFEI